MFKFGIVRNNRFHGVTIINRRRLGFRISISFYGHVATIIRRAYIGR